jgi:hypothetical protein
MPDFAQRVSVVGWIPSSRAATPVGTSGTYVACRPVRRAAPCVHPLQ